jgi:hypothetical protein
LQSIDGAVDDAAVETEQEAADRRDAADQDDQARVLGAVGGREVAECDAVHAWLLIVVSTGPLNPVRRV